LRSAGTAGARAGAPAVLALAATLLLSLLFLIAPGVDLAVSDLFFREGEGFPLSQDPLLRALRRSSTWVMVVALLGALAVMGGQVVRGRLPASRPARKAGWLLLGLALGPGLLVNGVLKTLWGRPRPVQVEVFGGDAPYVPVWQISDWCEANCSFVSGEAASASWTVAAVVLLPPAIRRRVLAPVLVYGVALSLNRVAFGGHFLSDVLLSWALTALVLGLLWRLMVEVPAGAQPRRRLLPAGRAGSAE
jgi:membrane-associated PAP2 superfamily phosphatase